jgi:tetratricopeptide (TPR) repeat protein
MPPLLTGWTREEIYYVAQRGHRLYREGRLLEAAMLYEGLIAIDPEDAYCRKALAAAYVRLNQYDRAIGHLDAVLAGNPLDAEALRGRTEALTAMRSTTPQLPAGAPDNLYGW